MSSGSPSSLGPPSRLEAFVSVCLPVERRASQATGSAGGLHPHDCPTPVTDFGGPPAGPPGAGAGRAPFPAGIGWRGGGERTSHWNGSSRSPPDGGFRRKGWKVFFSLPQTGAGGWKHEILIVGIRNCMDPGSEHAFAIQRVWRVVLR